MGDPFPAAHRENGAQTQAPGRRKLAHGLDLHQGQGHLEISLSRRRQARKDCRLSADGEVRHACGKALLRKALEANESPDKVAMDKSGANKAAIDAITAGRDVPIVMRQVKFVNNIVEQNRRAIKQVTRPMLDFKSFRCVARVIAGVELMHIIREGQFVLNGAVMSFANLFYALAGQIRPD